MSRTLLVLLLIISASLMMAAQTYHITPVVTSTSVIAGQDMHDCLAPNSVALSDAGEIAFALTCRTGERELTEMVLTGHRVVATDKELIGGKTARISTDGPIAINSHGQVAYVVTYVTGDPQEALDDETKWHTAICVDGHVVVQVPDKAVQTLTLADDGKVSFNQPSQSTSPTATSSSGQALQAIPKALHQIPVKLPPFKMPKNFPIGIPSIPQNQPIQSLPTLQPAPAQAANSSLSTFASNSRGQIVINARLTMFQFVILLATPAN